MAKPADGRALYLAAYCRGIGDPDPVRDALAAAEHALEEKALDAMIAGARARVDEARLRAALAAVRVAREALSG